MEATLGGPVSKNFKTALMQNNTYSMNLEKSSIKVIKVSEMDQPLLNHDTVISYHPTGSRYICNPAPMDTDEDWVVLIKSERQGDFNKHMTDNEFWRSHKNYFSNSDFQSWRHRHDPSVDDVRNFIVTADPEWYQLFVEATEIAKEENLLKKEDRIKLFELIMAKVRKKEERQYQKTREYMMRMAELERIQQKNYNQYLEDQYKYQRMTNSIPWRENPSTPLSTTSTNSLFQENHVTTMGYGDSEKVWLGRSGSR